MKARIAAVALLLAAACSGSTGPTSPGSPSSAARIPAGASPLVAAMFERLPSYIAATLAEQQANLPANSHSAVQITAKIALLQRPTLIEEMVNGRTFIEGSVTSSDGRSIAIAALFPEEGMRAEAFGAVRKLERTVPFLETFIDTAYPADTLQVWYGFKVGNSGSRGTIYAEDRTSYESRPRATLPFDSALTHELSHSYLGNESLTQFLEIYLFNQLNGATQPFESWTYRRDYTGMWDSNEGYAAVIDVYRLIGHDSMSRAYKLTYPLHPPYGQPLPQPVQQVFIDQAPDASRAQVTAKISRVRF